MPVEISPIQLAAYYVRDMAFGIRPDLDENLRFEMQGGVGLQQKSLFDPDPLTVNVRVGLAGHSEDPRRWKCEVHIDSQNPPDRRYPYDFRAVLVGYFQVAEQIPTDRAEMVVTLNGPSVLYSAARELFASVTGRGPFPHVLLPTVVFSPDVEPEQQQGPTPEAVAPEAGKAAAKKVAKKGAAKKGKGKKQQR